MRTHISILFLLIPIAFYSQNFDDVDAKVLVYPRYSKVEELAKRIEKDFSTDANKVRAGFFWLAKNIRYNLKEFYNPKQRYYSFEYSSITEKEQKLQGLKDKLIAATFRNKTGVCEEYAQSLKKICDLLGIEAAVIKGYVRNNVKEIGIIANTTNHAWNAVKIDGKWIILDATWGAGFERNGRWIREFNDYFFNMPKENIFKTHYPDDSIWVLRFGRMSLETFFNQPIYKNALLKSKSELMMPASGIIEVVSSKDIILKFKNLDSSALISYRFKGEKYAKKTINSKEKNISTVLIKNPKRNSELNVFINNSDALHFKVIQR